MNSFVQSSKLLPCSLGCWCKLDNSRISYFCLRSEKHVNIWHWRKPWCGENTEGSMECLVSLFQKLWENFQVHGQSSQSERLCLKVKQACRPMAAFWAVNTTLTYNGYRQVYRLSSRGQSHMIWTSHLEDLIPYSFPIPPFKRYISSQNLFDDRTLNGNKKGSLTSERTVGYWNASGKAASQRPLRQSYISIARSLFYLANSE